MQFWKKIIQTERQIRVKKALSENVNFSHDTYLAYQASKLDGKVFNEEAQFLKDSPILQTYLANPIYTGCHAFGTAEKAFSGSQGIEREVLDLLAVEIFKAQPNTYDGYIALGRTESNLQAISYL